MNPPATTLERLRKIIVRDFNVDPNLLKPDARLEDLDIDSLGVIEIMFGVEEEFNITVPHRRPDTSVSLATLDDLARYVDQLVSEQRGADANRAAP